MTMYIQVPKIGPHEEGSTVVEAEQEHIGRVKIEFYPSAYPRLDCRGTYCQPNDPHFPDRYEYRQSRSTVSISLDNCTYQA